MNKDSGRDPQMGAVGQYRRRLVCICGGMFLYFAHVTAFFPVLPLYLTQRWADGAAVGLVVGSMAAGILLMRPWIGMALDRWGRKPVLWAGLGIALLIQPLYGLATSPWELVPVRVLHGLSQACFATASHTLLADLVPPPQRTAMLGYLAMSNTLGFALGPWLGSQLWQQWGWNGFLLGLLGLLVLGVGISLPLPWQKPPPTVSILSTTEVGSPWLALTQFPVREATFFFFISSLLHGGMTTFLPLVMTEAANFYSLYALGAVFVRFALGKWGDQISHHWTVAAGLVCSGVTMIGLTLSTDLTWLWAVLYSLGFGALFPVLSAIVSLAVPAERRGRVLSLFLMGFDSGMTLGGAGMGSLLGLMTLPQLFMAGGLLGICCGGLAFCQLRRPLPIGE
ncbi:MAG: MFS transporter [Cyanobacteriota bacterium]|nr:MFS transporter [Cyanobacteriota bacterium]